ncbi:MAG: hypothetical protein NVSMB47_14000 [Polyangiales bacterium]
MLFRLFIVAASLLHPNDSITRGFLADAVVHARAVAYADDEAPLFTGEDGRYKTALLLISIAHHESRWNPKALNPQGDAGIMQTRSLWWEGHTRAEILADQELGFRLGLHALRSLKETCGGNALRWLGAFASGKCGGAQSVAYGLCGKVGVCFDS